MKRAVLILAALFAFIIAFWLIVVPEEKLAGVLENSVKNPGFFLSADGFKKGLFYAVSAQRILLNQRDAEEGGKVIFACEGFSSRLNLLSVLKLSPRMDFDCNAGRGKVMGWINIFDRGTLKINGISLHLSEIPFFETQGIQGDGNLTWNMQLNKGSGELRFSVDDVRLKSATVQNVFLPLDIFTKMKGAMEVKGDNADITSFALEGEGIYARLKGSVRGNNLDASMELMMDSSLQSGYAYRALLVKYLVSPGYYVIPVKTNLAGRRDT